jgi:hypothetical protein
MKLPKLCTDSTSPRGSLWICNLFVHVSSADEFVRFMEFDVVAYHTKKRNHYAKITALSSVIQDLWYMCPHCNRGNIITKSTEKNMRLSLQLLPRAVLSCARCEGICVLSSDAPLL